MAVVPGQPNPDYMPCIMPALALRPAGMDEAGRGCLAGPVVAAAVILPAKFNLPGLGDSKTLTTARRSALAPKIKKCAMAWGLGLVWPQRIDSINILQASLEAMAIAIRTLKCQPDLLLVDGNRLIAPAMLSNIARLSPQTRQQAIVDGDKLVPAISAASILAKTFRDRLMVSLARIWPGYGFEKHKGYGTKQHYQALARLGPCPIHRFTFKGVANPARVSQKQLSL